MRATELVKASPSAGTADEVIAARIAVSTESDAKPFVGLVPLEEEDAKLLAGRDDEVRVLSTNLRAARLTLVYGASGAGKSSLLRAGVIATLHKLAKEDLNNFGTPCFSVAIMNSWAGDPFVQLAESVREGIRRALDVETLPPLPITTDLVETLKMWTDSFGLELLIILDQFEEFFLYHDKEDGPGTFAHELPRAINKADLRVRFLLSLRDDSLYKLDRFQNSLPSLFENRLQVLPLTIENARQAIHKAIDAYNEAQPATAHVDIEEDLVEAVLDQVRTDNLGREKIESTTQSLKERATGSTPNPLIDFYIDTPYMQLVMSRLWDEESAGWQKGKSATRILRLATFTRLGSAQAVVQQHLDRVMQNFSSYEQRIASDCFYRLVTPGGSKYALTPEELEKWAHHRAEEIKSFLEKLVDNKYRIIRRVDKKVLDGIQTAYEAHHDRLALAMLGWQERHKEKHRLRRSRFLALSIMVLIAVPIGYSFYRQRHAATSAQENANEALTLLNQVEQTSNTAEESDRLKLTDLKSLVPKFTCKNTDTTLRSDTDKINQILQIDCGQFQQVIANPNDAQLPPRVYFQIQTEDQRSAAEDLKRWLLSQKYAGRKATVPGIENVGTRNLRVSQLKYFHNNTQELNWAWLIVTSLRNVCVDVYPQLIKGYEESTAIRSNHFELWLTSDALDNLRCNNNTDEQK